MVKVKIFGSVPPCAKCKDLEKVAKKIAEKYPNQIEVSKFAAVSDEGDKYGIIFTPAVVVNDKVISSGKLMSESELEVYIRKELGGYD